MLQRIFKRSKKTEPEFTEPDIDFGRYSDNNKSVEKVEKWNKAESLFKEKKYVESIHLFFEYLKDDETDNVVHEPDGKTGKFYFYQGSKIIRGFYNEEKFEAEVALAQMPQPNTPVMRRLLELNFYLYYSRYAINGDKLFMLFDSDLETANPSKLYYGLKELATKADKQDDMLMADFTTLLPTDSAHIEPIDEREKEIKFKYFKKWIKEVLELIEQVDADKNSGGIAYVLLSLAYRIDYLILPQSKLQNDIEKIVSIYFKKDDRPVTDKNQDMIHAFGKLAKKSSEQFSTYLFRSSYTFSIASPQSHKTVADALYNANQNANWYKDNNHPKIAAQISEYGFAYCHYSYSLPCPLSKLFKLFMMVNYPDYFAELGFTQQFYNPIVSEFNQQAIIDKIKSIQDAWKIKYPEFEFNTAKLNFTNMVSFNQSFTGVVEELNLSTK